MNLFTESFDMKLTIKHRLKLCWEALTITSGHKHTAQEKHLPIFIRGYNAGLSDGRTQGSEKYQHLIMQVQNKVHGENRHETT